MRIFFANFWPSVSNFQKFFLITRTLHSNSERSEQFWEQNDFLTCSWRLLNLIRIQIGKKHAEKVRKCNRLYTNFNEQKELFFKPLFSSSHKIKPHLTIYLEKMDFGNSDVNYSS